MCRLYTFRSTHPRKIECELVAAQNSLLHQSAGDANGQVHADGWGLARYTNTDVAVLRQASAASASAEFRWAVAEVHTTNAVAHVRSATVGGRDERNTHPFRWGHWVFAHNGTIAAFPLVREELVAALAEPLREFPRGDTDSEHLFHLALSERVRDPSLTPGAALRRAIHRLRTWTSAAEHRAEFAVNAVLTDGHDTAIVRWGRSLSVARRAEVHACQVCGLIHVDGPPPRRYRAVVVASEPITGDEEWTSVPEGRVLTVSAEAEVGDEPLW